ncbi:MAG: rRNA cytosine-C5-methyltransferase [Bacteroidia bacterium]|nr:rRNA cytosine-C5-methyltransferase [Bacteroidia bacterium]
MLCQCNNADLFFNALNENVPVSIRLNPKKSKTGYDFKKVNWCSTGFYLDQRPSFTHDPLFHAGTYFVQEASSMFLEQFILQTGMHEKPITALDLCASPGGKSTHLLSLLHPDSLLVSNEAIRSRIPALKENIIKWGFPNVIITNNDPSVFSGHAGMFDLIVCDAPCSGEGMFRKDREAINHWSEAHVKHCADRQKRIVQQAWKALKAGGIFIYSTCTYNKEENENVLQHLIDINVAVKSIPVNVSGMGDIDIQENPLTVYRFYPHLIIGEGFTIAGLTKSEKDDTDERTLVKMTQPKFKISNHTAEWLNSDNGSFFEHNGKLHFLKDQVSRFIAEEGNKLNIVSAGTETAEIKGRVCIPLHESCMSILYRRKSFPEIELGRNDALNYLKGETRFQIDASDGTFLFTCHNLPLGFARKTGNRFNNHYPKAWRIRKGNGS